MTIKSPVIVLGAGPGGATTALFLAKAGIECVLIDKAVFPRDKVCGDALSGKVVETMIKIQPDLVEKLEKQAVVTPCLGIEFVAPNSESLKMRFRDANIVLPTAPGYITTRIEFDHFLVKQAKASPKIQVVEGCEIAQFEKQGQNWILSNADKSQTFETPLVIVANGAHSQFSKKVAGIAVEPRHYCAGLRAYYKGVEGFDETNSIELHFLKEFLPGYFWIFPLGNGMANVGVGMRTDHVSKNKINLKKEMEHIIQNHPKIAPRFKNAVVTDDIKGYGLPLGSKKRSLSGDGYMLIGDAGSLIDPFTGEGIGNAMWSGDLAAEQAVKAVQANRYDAAFLADYDKALYKKLGGELQLSYQLQKLVHFPWLFNWFVRQANTNRALREAMMGMFDNIDNRAQLKNPLFYLKILFNWT